MTTLARALAMLAFCAPAHAADRIYRLNTDDWALYSVTRSLPQIKAPDGSLVTPVLANATVRGNIGPAGYVKAGASTTGLHVAPGGLDQFSVFYRWLGGPTGTHSCIDGNITGYAVHQCLDFDGATGTYNSSSPAITSYSIVQIGEQFPIAPGSIVLSAWYRVSITFSTADDPEYGDQAFPYIESNVSKIPGQSGQRFAVWKGELITGQAP
jgi:hypothetical protein